MLTMAVEGSTRVGILEESVNGSGGMDGGAYSGMVRMSNWEIREMVRLR